MFVCPINRRELRLYKCITCQRDCPVFKKWIKIQKNRRAYYSIINEYKKKDNYETIGVRMKQKMNLTKPAMLINEREGSIIILGEQEDVEKRMKKMLKSESADAEYMVMVLPKTTCYSYELKLVKTKKAIGEVVIKSEELKWEKSGERYICSICGKSYATQRGVESHIDKKH